MSNSLRTALLILVVVGIIVAIWYLESQKVHTPGGASAGIDLDALNDSIYSTGSTSSPARTPDFAQRAQHYAVARELVSPDGYINVPADTAGEANPITIKSLIGKKIILLDFWTYSCINCQRTFPYLNGWYEKYKNLGLEIIGVHSPEFQFEKDMINVKTAVSRFGIQYPVVLDNGHQTWNAYNNLYWPEHYLIDINGLIVDRHIGEGGYEETERKIQQLLRERAAALSLAITIPTNSFTFQQSVAASSPETYFGASRNEYLVNGVPGQIGIQNLSRPQGIRTNDLGLVGTWDLSREYAKNTSASARIIYRYNATNVYFVASSVSGVRITVLRDGVIVNAEKGADVDSRGTVEIKEPRLYKLIREPSQGAHTLEIIIENPGLDAYTFTFG